MPRLLLLQDFSGGLINRYSQNLIPDNSAIFLRNARFTRKGTLTKRNGTTRTSITVASLGAINTLFAKEGSTTEELLMSDGDQVAVVGTSLASPSSLITGLNNEWPPEFLTFNGATYMTNGNDGVRKITTNNTVSTISASPVARFHVAHRGYVHTFNQDAGGLKNRWQWSNSGDPETWTATDFEDINPFGNSAILGAYAFGDELIVFQGPDYTGALRTYNTGKMYRILGDVFDGQNPTYSIEPIELPPDVGLLGPAHRSIKALKGVLYFVTNRGIFAYKQGGGMPESVSEAIGGDIDQWEKADINTAIRNPAGAIWKDEYYLSMYNPTYSADTYNNRLYVLDRNGNIFQDIIDDGSDSNVAGGGTGSSFAIFNGGLYGCTGHSSLLRQWDVSGQSETQDDGTSGGVNLSFLSKEFDFKRKVEITHLYVHLKRQSAGTLTFIVNTDQRGDTSNSISMSTPDTGDVANSSSAVLRQKVNVGRPCRTIQFRAHDLSSNDVEIYATEVWGKEIIGND